MMALGVGGRLMGLYDEGYSLLPLILLPYVGAISFGSTGVFYLDGKVAVCYVRPRRSLSSRLLVS